MSFTKNSKYTGLFLLLFTTLWLSCSSDPEPGPAPGTNEGEKLTIFFFNDNHGEMLNFSRIKYLVEEEREENPVLLVSAGDAFSGSPYVDQYQDPGFPMIDIMNQTGVDIGVLGNHEFDYGLDVLQDRIEQSEFDWICANVDVKNTGLSQPAPYKTITVGDFKVTFLGLIETFGAPDRVIPATHPWRIQGLEFQRFDEVVGQYENLKAQEDADVYVALTHLGSAADRSLATNFPYFDLIIGGHTNNLTTEPINGIPTLMAGFDLFWLGKAVLTIKDKEVVDSEVSLIELWNERNRDENLEVLIENYTDDISFEEVVGSTATELDEIGELGCLYTTALKEYMNVDVTIQNLGGIRSQIDQGEITKFEVFEMDPFNNGSVVYHRTVQQLKDFLRETGATFAFSGVQIERSGSNIIIRDTDGVELANDVNLTLGTNDYIAAVYQDYFPRAEAEIRPLTTAESIIAYLQSTQGALNFEGCERIFRY